MVALLCAGAVALHVIARGERQVAGTVQSASWRLNDETGHVYPFIEVKLDGGASVRVGNAAPALPGVGDRITLRQHALIFDYLTTYEWDGPGQLLPATAQTPDPGPTPVSLP
jgi:hypothetical protein